MSSRGNNTTFCQQHHTNFLYSRQISVNLRDIWADIAVERIRSPPRARIENDWCSRTNLDTLLNIMMLFLNLRQCEGHDESRIDQRDSHFSTIPGRPSELESNSRPSPRHLTTSTISPVRRVMRSCPTYIQPFDRRIAQHFTALRPDPTSSFTPVI